MSSTLKVNTIQGATNTATTIKTNGGTDAITIDTSGNITTGGTFAIGTHVYARASSDTGTTSGNNVTLNTGQESSGGMAYTDTNTAIQVPLAGLYLIGHAQLGNQGSGNLQMQIRKNGTALPGTHFQETGNANDAASLTTVAVLAANDKITFHVAAGASHGNASFNNHFVVKIG